ncbi:MAG TPA: UDP-N-acetylglucosamine pyrophosphorylase [Firmicutes bacterium]|nr:UDP-N-acetylglucosamine pyrophosphorylase [Bacillota bacterium]
MQFPRLSLEHSVCKPLFERARHPFEVLPCIHSFILLFSQSEQAKGYCEIHPLVFAHRSVNISPSVVIEGPAIIGENTILRPNAYLRQDVVIGKNCVIGNSTEIKNSILFDNVEAPHFNYIGDSLIGYDAHFGAGAITSNFKQDGSEIVLKEGETRLPTGLRKMGAIVGDYAEIGCNVVLNPGSVIGNEARIYPLLSIRGFVDEKTIVKGEGAYVRIE